MSGWDPPPKPKEVDPAILRAKAAGFRVIRADSNQLLLDLDDGQEINAEVLEKIRDVYGTPEIKEWPSKSARGRHVVLTFKNGWLKKNVAFTDAEATALECALGSDPLRAVGNIVRIKMDKEDVRILFQPDTVPADVLEAYQGLSTEEQQQVFAAGARILNAR